MSQSDTVANAFDVFTRLRLESPTVEKIWRESFGETYAKQARPNGFYSQSVLDNIVTAVGDIAIDRSLLDVGCGHGLAGADLAQRLHASHLGIDISPDSIAVARQTARQQATDSKFCVADATATGFEECTFAVVVCLDVLLYFKDKLAAMREIHRVLEPGGLFAFTTWEQKGYNDRLGAEQVSDYRPILEEAGFVLETYGPIQQAREVQEKLFENVIEAESEIREECGEKAAVMLANMAHAGKKESSGRRYVLGIARRAE